MTILALLLCTPLQQASTQKPPQAERPFALMVGDAAPAIQIVDWVQGAPIAKFEPGQTYVVEFWATWCGPCKIAIPHLNELSHEYKDSVHFLGVSIWEDISKEEPYSVPKFVAEMGDKMTYTVASDRTKADDEPRMAKAWMEAAGQNGIPTAFIVNKDGRVAWIGHPMGIDKPLADVVAGKWDLAAAAAKYAQDMASKGATKKLGQEIAKAKKAKDYVGALAALDKALAHDPTLEASFGIERYFLLLDAQRAPEAASYGQHLVSDVLASSAMSLNKLAWSIVDPSEKRADGDWMLAVAAAEKAVELTEHKNAAILDTLGLALFKAGNVARAIEVQQQAAELSKGTPDEKDIRDRLEQFKGAKAKQGV